MIVDQLDSVHYPILELVCGEKKTVVIRFWGVGSVFPNLLAIENGLISALFRPRNAIRPDISA